MCAASFCCETEPCCFRSGDLGGAMLPLAGNGSCRISRTTFADSRSAASMRAARTLPTPLRTQALPSEPLKRGASVRRAPAPAVDRACRSGSPHGRQRPSNPAVAAARALATMTAPAPSCRCDRAERPASLRRPSSPDARRQFDLRGRRLCETRRPATRRG